MEQSFGAGGRSPRGGGRSPDMATTPRQRGQSATPNRDGGFSPNSPGGGSVSPGGNGEMMIHPSHRGTNYMRKPPKKKKKKRKRPKSPQAGQYTTLALPEDQRNQRMFVNPDDPYYRGADLANGYSPGGVTLEGNQGTGRGKFQEGYWRDGTPGGGGGQGTPGGADASPGRVSGVMGVAGAGAGVAGAAGYQGDGDGRSQGGDRSPGGGAGYMGAGAGGVGGAAGAGDDSATDAERLDRIDYRGGGGAKRFYGDIEDDKATPWTTGNGITKRPKKAKKEDDGTPDTPMRSQKELYVDYDKLAEFEQQEVKTMIGAEVEDPDKFWELIDPDQEDQKQYTDDNYISWLSWKRVKMHQYRTHPRNRMKGTIYNCCDADISYLPICMCCINRSKWVTPAAREIGIGPTLFLMTVKALAYLFLFLMILNIPLMMFYSTGGGSTKDADEQQSVAFTDIFGLLSIGNLGVSDYTCSNINIAKVGYNSFDKKKLYFNCPYGTMRNFTQYGIQKRDNQSCTDKQGFFLGEGNKKDDLQLDCSFDHGLSEFGKGELMNEFESKCLNQQTCSMKLKWSWFNKMCRRRIWYYSSASKFNNFAEDLNWSFYKRNDYIREPVLFGVVFCVSDKMFDPFSGKEMEGYYKGDFVYVIILLDLVVILSTIWLINFLMWRYKQYAMLYDKRAVEMRDFTCRITNLPRDYEFGGKERMLQAQLWNHIEITLQRAMEKNAQRQNDLNALEQVRQDKLWEIVDITFARSDLDEQEMLERIDEKDREKKKLIRDVQLIKMDKENDRSAEIPDLEQQIIEKVKEFKIMKQEYVRIQEEMLYEKYEITESNGRSMGDQSFQCAYVTFRSMQGKEKCMQCFEFAEQIAKQVPSETEKMFFNRWLKFVSPPAPTSMIWKHQIYSECNRWTRTIIIWLLAVGIIIAAFYLMIFFKDMNDRLSIQAGINVKCGKTPPTPEEVLDDYEKDLKQRQGFVHCFCQNYKDKNGTLEGTQKMFLELDDSLDVDICQEWQGFRTDSQLMIIITGAVIGIINSICVAIFEFTPILFEKCLTYAEETLAQFNRIFVIQFLNIGCLLLFADFSTGYTREEMGVPFLAGKYRDFDTKWYYDVGAKISVAMISNSLIGPFTSQIAKPIVLIFVKRWVLDRCFKRHLRKLHNIQEELAELEEQQAKEAGDGEPQDPPGDEAEGGAQEIELSKVTEEDEAVIEEGGNDTNRQLTQSKYTSNYYNQSQNPSYYYDEGGDDQDGPPPGGASPFGQPNGEPGADGMTPGGEWQVEDDECETKQYFQDDLNELYSGPLIETFFPYAWFFTNILIYYMYGGGMPFMYVLGFLHFLICYWVWKWLLFTYFRKAYNFDEMVPIYAVNLIKYAVLVHLIMICFMFTNKRLLTPKDYTIDVHYRPAKEPPHRFFRRRYDITSTQVVLWMAITILICYFLYRFFILVIWRLCQNAKKRKQAADMLDEDYAGDDVELKAALADDHSDDIYKEMNIQYLRDLYIRSRKEFEQFRTMFNAISYDQEKLSDDYAKHFKKKLKNRINNIEDTVDLHCNLIGGLERWMDQSYMYKLAALEVNEEKIPLKDEKCMRIIDLVQSYYIYDSLEYNKPKQIMQRIDREMLELDVNEDDAPVYC